MVATVGRNVRSSGLDVRGRVVIGRAGEPDAHAVDGHDGAVLEVRQRLPIGAAQVGGIERELGLRHALQEDRLAEIEFVIARRENVGREQIGEREMRAPRSRPDISDGDSVSPPCAKITLAALGALGLDYGGEPREAAALPVGHHLIRHQIDVIDQDEGDACGLGAGRGGADDRDQQHAGGETANGGHGEEAAF